MAKTENVQISKKLFMDITRYFLMNGDSDPELTAIIKKQIQDKLDAYSKHEIYSKYKTAASPEEKEKARQEYLDRIGISPDFRW